MAVSMTASRDDVDGPAPDFERFQALFADELAELRALADERDVALEAVSDAYFAIVSGGEPMITHGDLQDALGRDGPEAWNIASVLVEFGEVHRSKGEHWWWIVASQYLAEQCERRSISLQQYYAMEDDLRVFQDDVVEWYQRRQMNGNLQERTMREIKREHCERLQEKYFPDTELDPEGNLHDHQVGRYVKTAQDVIVEALDLSY